MSGAETGGRDAMNHDELIELDHLLYLLDQGSWETDTAAAAAIRSLLAERDEMQQHIDALQARVHLCAGYDALVAENDRLKAGYSEAVDDIEDWAIYAGEYFQWKHDLVGRIERHRAALAGGRSE
jgi:hypothetical protein